MNDTCAKDNKGPKLEIVNVKLETQAPCFFNSSLFPPKSRLKKCTFNYNIKSSFYLFTQQKSVWTCGNHLSVHLTKSMQTNKCFMRISFLVNLVLHCCYLHLV